MLIKLLASRIVDILLIAAALYFLFPGVRERFAPRRKQQPPKQNRYTVVTNDKHKGSGKYDGAGEYVDYEEVK
jgi:hypothetical protein